MKTYTLSNGTSTFVTKAASEKQARRALYRALIDQGFAPLEASHYCTAASGAKVLSVK